MIWNNFTIHSNHKKRAISVETKFRQKAWKFHKLIVSLQRERRNRVEPRCAERWHLCDDEQFDLAAWFPSLAYSWSRVASLFHNKTSFWKDSCLFSCSFRNYCLPLHSNIGAMPRWRCRCDIVGIYITSVCCYSELL